MWAPVLTAFLLALGGYATITAGTTQNVTIDTMNAKGAECRVILPNGTDAGETLIRAGLARRWE